MIKVTPVLKEETLPTQEVDQDFDKMLRTASHDVKNNRQFKFIVITKQ